LDIYAAIINLFGVQVNVKNHSRSHFYAHLQMHPPFLLPFLCKITTPVSNHAEEEKNAENKRG
jgi:hypothetical protein